MEVEERLKSLIEQLISLEGDGQNSLGEIQKTRNRLAQLEEGSDEYNTLQRMLESLEAEARFLPYRIATMEKMAEGNGRQLDVLTQLEGYMSVKENPMEYVDDLTASGNVQRRQTINNSALVSFIGLDNDGNRLNNGVRISFEYDTKVNGWKPNVRGGSQARTALGEEIRAILNDTTIVEGLTESEVEALQEILELVDSRTRGERTTSRNEEQQEPAGEPEEEKPEEEKPEEEKSEEEKPEEEKSEEEKPEQEEPEQEEPTRTAEEIREEMENLRSELYYEQLDLEQTEEVLNDPSFQDPGNPELFMDDAERQRYIDHVNQLRKNIERIKNRLEKLKNEKPIVRKEQEEQQEEQQEEKKEEQQKENQEEQQEEKKEEPQKENQEQQQEEQKDDEEAKKRRRLEDVLPVLRELEQIKVVPALDFEAIYAYEADRRIAKYKEELAKLEDIPENAREKERLENIIDELESLPRIRAKNKEKNKEESEKGDSSRGLEGEEKSSGGEGEKDSEKSSGPRHWVEIMAETQTQSSGSIPTYFHQMGKIQPFRMGLTIWAAPVKLVMKGAGKLFGDAMGRCQAKKNEMLKNIRNLSDEEFEILVNGLTETNMRQYKVNEIYLDAVQEVLTEKENAKKQAAIDRDNGYRQAIAYNDGQIDKLKKDLENPALTPEQQISLQIELQQHILVDSYLRIQHEQAYQAQIAADRRVTDFDRGKVGKSTRRMNIQGWLAGSFNPDNRELHQQEAALRKEQREAGARGDTDQVLETQRKIEKLQKDNTHIIQLLQGTRFEGRARVNRGLHTAEEVHQRSNDAEQTKGRELVATIMAAVTFANMVNTYQANQAAQQQIDQHNAGVRTANDQNARLQQEIDDVNAHNADLQRTINSANSQNGRLQQEIRAANSKNATVQGQVESARGMVSDKELAEAATREIHENNALTYAARHEEQFRLANDPSGSKFNIGRSDTALHEAQSAWSQSRTAAQQNGTLSQEVASSAQRAQQAASDVIQGAAQFPSLPGKGAFTNSEYVQNLQYIMSSQTDSFSLLQKLLGSTRQIGDTVQITGTAAQINDSVAQILGSTASVAEMAPLVLDTSAATLVNILPFITAMTNLTQLEVKKAQMDQDKKQREEANVDKNKEARKEKETRSGDER